MDVSLELNGRAAIVTGGSRGLGREMALAFGPTVRVNGILAGPFMTDIATAWPPEMLAAIERRLPLQRAGQPNEIVGAALYFASDASSYTTGAILKVDGGAVA